MQPDFGPLTKVIEKDGYLWLSENAPEYLKGVREAVNTSASADEIRHKLQMEIGPDRNALILACWHAARYLISIKNSN